VGASDAVLKRTGIVGKLVRLFRQREIDLEARNLAGLAVSAGALDNLDSAFEKPSSTLEAAYLDMRVMDDSVVEVSEPLNILSENAMSSDVEQEWPFIIRFVNQNDSLDEMVSQLVHRTGIANTLVPLTREALLMGNEYRQIGVGNDLLVTRLMYLAPETMRVQTDEHGVLLSDCKAGDSDTWAYIQSINETVKGMYYPWEIAHTKWGVRGGSLYGTPLFYTARWPWRKLVAMEDALVVNWLTRAFARLLFKIDVTGKSEKEAQDAIRLFRVNLERSRIGQSRAGQQSMQLIRDIFVGTGYHELMGSVEPGLADVKVLDTSGSAFENMSPLEYYQNKILMAGRVPKAYLGMEADINAKATLAMQDRQYARTIASVQRAVGRTIHLVITVQMLLLGMDPRENMFTIQWHSASRADIVDLSLAQLRYSQAAQTWAQLGIIDNEYAATRFIGMSPAEFAQIVARIQQQAKEAPTRPVQSEPKPEPSTDGRVKDDVSNTN